ncbi:MAG TPA: hypothetical protein VNI54_05790 [Thermoanaerobaculia bacterium]|nr:hypothetical protein [Thermoanaerobaculia bacterium]
MSSFICRLIVGHSDDQARKSESSRDEQQRDDRVKPWRERAAFDILASLENESWR